MSTETTTGTEPQEIAMGLVLEAAKEIEFLSVAERLDDLGIADDNGDLARKIHDLAMAAKVTVAVGPPEPGEHEIPPYTKTPIPGTPLAAYHQGDEESYVRVGEDGLIKLCGPNDWFVTFGEQEGSN